jgi:hypothetical protein
MERVKQNYEDFKRTTLQLDEDSIFEYAPTIAAVQDVYFYMTTHDWADAEQTEYLLQFENPLRLLADLWEEENEDRGADFGDMLDKISDDGYEDFTEGYITVTLADELRDKYGDDIPLDGAIICEIVELGKKLFKC